MPAGGEEPRSERGNQVRNGAQLKWNRFRNEDPVVPAFTVAGSTGAIPRNIVLFAVSLEPSM